VIKIEYKFEKKLDSIENEIKNLKAIILSSYGNKIKKPVSFRGIAKTELSDIQLDKAIEEAKKSLAKGI
jgi:hypothetical protein